MEVTSESQENSVDEGARTLFSTLKIYPYTKPDKIPTDEFLDVSRGVIILVESLGKAFAPVKFDIQGNINKLQKKFEQDDKAHKYLQDMILLEKELGQELLATDALQWLRRSLHFIASFFKCMIEDYNDDMLDENLSRYLKTAYGHSLERFHGWLGSQLFSILCKFIPKKVDLFKILGMNVNDIDDQIMEEMDVYTNNLFAYVDSLTEFYSENNLETFDRV